jgi:hypothetical protein
MAHSVENAKLGYASNTLHFLNCISLRAFKKLM